MRRRAYIPDLDNVLMERLHLHKEIERNESLKKEIARLENLKQALQQRYEEASTPPKTAKTK